MTARGAADVDGVLFALHGEPHLILPPLDEPLKSHLAAVLSLAYRLLMAQSLSRAMMLSVGGSDSRYGVKTSAELAASAYRAASHEWWFGRRRGVRGICG
jgi:hypothetical protein